MTKTSEAKKSETHLKLKAKASSEDSYGASSKKEITSTHAKPKANGRPSDQPLVNRKNFSAVKNVRQDETFTNNESLPGMEKAYKQFIRLYPEYRNTLIIDEIRAREYAYLNDSGHVCLDYSGYGLFSKWQETWHKASASFGLSYISVNLPTHALYGGADEGTAEYDIKKMVSEFLNIQESEYAMVFTASRGSAFKLLGESYPFHINKKLLTVYDYESDAVKWIEEAAQKRGAEIVRANFRWPSQRLWATDLKKKILEKAKTKKEPGKGLFVFPVQSRATGAKYSYQWMSQAQENGWDILLDASALGPNAMGSLGLCVFRPDFIVSSFFKVYGSDPTGFGCLMIKRSVIQRLHSSSAARGVGMVRLVPASLLSEGQHKGGGLLEPELAVHGSLRFTERRPTKSTCTSAGPSQQFYMPQAYSSTSEFFPKASGEPARAEDDKTIPSVSYKQSAFLPKLHRHKESAATSSTSRKLARQGVPSFSNEFSAHGLSLTKPQQKFLSSLDRMEEVYSFDDYEEMATLESAYYLGLNDDLRGEDQSNPEESRSPADFDGERECETSRRGILQQDWLYMQHHVSASRTTMNGHKDSSVVFSEDASLAFFYDDEDYEDASLPFKKNVDDDDDDDAAKAFDVTRKEHEIVCRGLQHAHELGLNGSNTRLRCLVNWLIASMLKLRHPGSSDAHRLVQIYGPKVNYDRGASVAFNLFDWKGNLLQPLLVQRLADRSNISFGIMTLNHIHLPKSSSTWPIYVEHLNKSSSSRGREGEARCVGKSPSMEVITISLCILSNFQDVYRFWVFLANFLDADFVSKEVWLYRSLNQETVVLGIEEPSKSSST